MDQNGHHIMTELKCFKFVLSDSYDLFLDYKDTSKGIGVSTSHMGVRGHGVAHEVHQNAPKCTKMLTITRDSKVFQNCPE